METEIGEKEWFKLPSGRFCQGEVEYDLDGDRDDWYVSGADLLKLDVIEADDFEECLNPVRGAGMLSEEDVEAILGEIHRIHAERAAEEDCCDYEEMARARKEAAAEDALYRAP